MEQVKTAVAVNNLSKKFKGFTLDIPCLKIPQGFATALIGENGAGKTTLLNALAGVRLDYKGTWSFSDSGMIRSVKMPIALSRR